MSRSAGYSLTSVSEARPLAYRFGRATTVAAEYEGPNISFKLLIVFLLVLYSNLGQLYPSLNSIRPAFATAIAATGMMVFEVANSRRNFRLSWPQGYLMLALLGAAVLSTFQAIYVRLGYNTTSDLAKIVLIYIVLENTITSRRRVRTILWTLAIGGLFPALGTIQHYMQGVLIEGSRASWIGIFKNPNESAYALVMLTPVAAAVGSTSSWRGRVLSWGIVAAYLLAIFLTFSRGGLLGLLVVLALIGWKQRSIALKAVMVVGLVASVLVASIFWGRKKDFTDIGGDATVNQRVTTMKAGLAMFADKPILGVGPGCSVIAFPLYVAPGTDCNCQRQLVIHNAFIQVLGELGILGFLPFVALFGTSIFQMRRIQRASYPSENSMNACARGIELGLWGFIACGLSGGFAYTWFPYIFLGVGVAIQRLRGDANSAGAKCPA